MEKIKITPINNDEEQKKPSHLKQTHQKKPTFKVSSINHTEKKISSKQKSVFEIKPIDQDTSKKDLPIKQNFKRKIIIISTAIILVTLGFIGFSMANSYLSSVTKSIFSNGQGVSLNLLFGDNNIPLKGEDRGRTNIMIYGLTLDEQRTDTMLLASYYWNEHKLVLLNIPRDIYAKYKSVNTKIVSLYAIGKAIERQLGQKDKTYAPQLVSDFISSEYNIPIDYWVVGNMNAFKQLVNTIGGVTIDVQTPFTDYQYPTDDYSGYIRPAPHFDAGVQTMDGTMALIYARSRHSIGAEGSDFARSNRQQIVIKAIIEKLRDQGVLDNINKINDYLNIFGQNIFTDFTPTEALSLAKTIKGLDLSQDYLMTNWSTASGFLCNGMSADGQYILLYGVPNNCRIKAGANLSSPFRQEAIDFVQNLLFMAEQMKAQPGLDIVKVLKGIESGAINPAQSTQEITQESS